MRRTKDVMRLLQLERNPLIKMSYYKLDYSTNLLLIIVFNTSTQNRANTVDYSNSEETNFYCIKIYISYKIFKIKLKKSCLI